LNLTITSQKRIDHINSWILTSDKDEREFY